MKPALICLLSQLALTTLSHNTLAQAGTVSIQTALHNFDYREFNDSGEVLNNETGVTPVLGMVWTSATLDPGIEFSAGFSAARSDMDYQGRTQRGARLETTTAQRFTALFASTAYPLHYGDLTIKPELTLRQFNWQRDIQPKAPVNGLFEDYRWLELGVGLQFNYQLSDADYLPDAIGFGYRYATLHDGRMKIESPLFAPAIPVLRLGDGHRHALELNCRYDVARHYTLQLYVSLEQIRMSRGPIKTVARSMDQVQLLEPANRTRQTGVGLRLDYALP